MKVWDVLINSDNKMRHKYSEEDIEFLKKLSRNPIGFRRWVVHK